MSIRQVGPGDLRAAVQLFEIRDGRCYDPERIAHVVRGFQPERSLAWMAFDGAHPAGMTSMLVRELYIDRQRVRVGYWVNLYIRPEYRHTLLYPRLTLAMVGALVKNNIAFLYSAVREPVVTRAHRSFGFVKLGELPVRAKPLRPARLLVRHKSWKLPERFTYLPDFVYSRALRLHRSGKEGLEAYEIKSDVSLAEFTSLLNSTRSKIRQAWSVDRLEERYAGNREAEPYRFVGVRVQRRLIAAVIWRAAVRGNGVRAGVLMDVAWEAGAEPAARTVIAAAESHALRDGCDVMISLGGLWESRRVVDKAGYWTSPERYTVLLWPSAAAKNNVELADLGSWRFAFSDHDTF